MKKDAALFIQWKDLEERICGTPIVDIELLKQNTSYSSWRNDDQVIIWLWKALQQFSNEERILYLKFVWGRSRLPMNSEGFQRSHTINRMYSTQPDRFLPVSHTCFFTIDLPAYSSEEILYRKLRYAITFCTEIDNDYNTSAVLDDI